MIGGTRNNVAAAATDAGLETALVEPGPLGGTCLNRGCNPSKMLIQAATAVDRVRHADRFHVEASFDGVDQAAAVNEMDDLLGAIVDEMREEYREMEHLTLFDERPAFVDERTVALGGEAVTAEKVVVAAGSRPVVPPIDGLDDVPFLTSRDALYLRETPDRLVILGGGYIAVEHGYFFEAMGSDVAIVEKNDTLISREDGGVARAFTDVAAERHDVFTGYLMTAVEETEGEYAVHAEPQIAGVGATEEELEAGDTSYVVGRAEYSDSAMGRAKKLERGFVKVLAAPDGEILGAHVLGHEASTLIHEAVLAMRTGTTVDDVAGTIHAHPTLSRVLEVAFRDVSVDAKFRA